MLNSEAGKESQIDQEAVRRKKVDTDREDDYQARGFGMVIVMVPIFLAIDFWALDRPFFASVRYSLYLSAAVLLPMAAIIIFYRLSESKGRLDILQALAKHQSAILQIIAVGFAYYTIGAAVYDFYRYLGSPESGYFPTVLVTVVCTLSAGIGLFIFRIKKRLMYGITEIMVGLVVASYRVTTSDTTAYLHPEFYLVILTAGVYLVVRGLDNIHQVIKSDAKPHATTRNDPKPG